jgi:Skp family chaperone for outer membrane proteins
MKRTERTVIYAALGALLLLNVMLLGSSPGRVAYAEAAAFVADVLGPAEAVKLVDGDKDLTLRAKDECLAWGDGDFRRAYSIGFIDISRVLNPLMEATALKEERDTLRTELENTEGDYKSRLDAYGEQLKQMDPKSPEGEARIADARKVYAEYMEWGQQAVARRNEMDVKHFEKSYRELSSAVDIVAERLGVDIVLRFIPPEKEFKAIDAEQALMEIRLRTAVRYQEKLDITDEVLQELSIQETDR